MYPWRATNLLGGLTHEHEALSVRDDLRRVEGLLQVVDELLLVALERLLLWAGDNLAGTSALRLDSRETTSEDGLTNEGD